MPSTTVRISDYAVSILREMSTKEGKSMLAILDEALEVYRRKKFLSEVNESFARLKDNKIAWDEEILERQDWDNALGDGQMEAE